MAGKLSGGAIQSGTITTTQISSTLNTTIQAGGGPKITSIVYPGNDTAANTVGGQTLYVLGSGFKSNSTIYINGNAASSVTYVSSSNLSFAGPALSAATYPLYVINPEDGATAILVPGLQVSGEPTWVTGATLSEQDASSAWNISLSATGDAPLTYALAAGSSLPTGISLASNGVISGTITTPPESDTTYNFTVVASDAQNQDAERAFSVTASAGEGVLFANNVLLIHADGANNQTNHTFLDSSNNNFTITRNGNATQGSFSPFSQTGWSNYFDGTGDYLTTPSTGQFAPTGDFTISMWFYPTSFAASYYVLAGSWVSSGASDEWLIQYDNTGAIRFLTTTDSTFSSAGVVKLNQWNFLSVSRSGNTVTGYVNGSSFRSYTLTGTVGSASKTIYIGIQANASSWPYLGYISNLRLVSGSAESATPPTSASTAISGTSLLTCQSNRIKDSSSNNFTITRNGDVSVQAFSPFAPTAAYSTSSVGGSAYFDGTGDYLQVANNNTFDTDSTFTLECWYYQLSAGNASFFTRGGGNGSWSTSNGHQFLLFIENGTLYWMWNNAGGATSIGVSAPAARSWHHLAIGYNGTTTRFWVDGVSVGTNTVGYSLPTTRDKIYAGIIPDGTTYPLNGYLSGLRFVKGTDVYGVGNTNITVPAAPLTNVSNTSLLCNFTNAGIFDQTAKNVLETVGDAKVSTAQYKYGNGSMYFDGTGDYLVTSPVTDLNNFRTQDWTIEFWVKSTQTTRADIFGWNYSFSSSGWAGILANVSTSGQLEWYENTTSRISASSTGWNNNSWNHIAVTRSGNSVKMFLNGTQIGSTYTTSFSYGASSSGFIIGTIPGGGGALNGYIDDFRITKGYARYTANFTAPAAAFKDR